MRFRFVLTIALVFGFSHDSRAQIDSLPDVFPLWVGNQWTYRYSADYTDVINMACWTDTGSVILRVVQQIISNDSIRWGFEQRRYLQHRTLASLCVLPISISAIADTQTLEIIEQLTGRHQLYRTGNWINYLPDIYPFSKQHSDTTGIFRYRRVDVTGEATFRSRPDPFVNSTFTFRRGVGMERYQSSGYPATGLLLTVDHQLRSSMILGVDNGTSFPSPIDFVLRQNYPNPFNPTTRIEYAVPQTSDVSLKVFDVLGRELASLVNEEQHQGNYEVQFNGSSLSSGVLFYRLSAGGVVIIRKALLLK